MQDCNPCVSYIQDWQDCNPFVSYVQDWQDALCDGLHLSPAGSQLLFFLLRPVVDSLTSELPMIYPDWKEVDINNLTECLKP